jgi:hypothetical protein
MSATSNVKVDDGTPHIIRVSRSDCLIHLRIRHIEFMFYATESVELVY